MTDTAKLTEKHLTLQRTRLEGKTVYEMDRMLPPNGRYSFIAFQTVRRGRLAEEYRAECIAELQTMVSITDEQVALLEVKGSPNGRCGIVLRRFTDIEAEKEAERLKMEELNG